MDSIGLRHSMVIQSVIATGATLAMLEQPDRLWPWFVLGWAALAVLGLTGWITEAWEHVAIIGWFAALPLAWAGYWVQGRGYEVLGWICMGVAALYAVCVAVRALVALFSRKKT